MEVPEKVSLQDLLDEILARRRVKVLPGGCLIDAVKPHCACQACLHMREQLRNELIERREQLKCNNFQHAIYCEEHETFHHQWNECPGCQEERKKARSLTPSSGFIQLAAVPFCPRCNCIPCRCNPEAVPAGTPL